MCRDYRHAKCAEVQMRRAYKCWVRDEKNRPHLCSLSSFALFISLDGLLSFLRAPTCSLVGWEALVNCTELHDYLSCVKLVLGVDSIATVV
jgi:hypothetical protein